MFATVDRHVVATKYAAQLGDLTLSISTLNFCLPLTLNNDALRISRFLLGSFSDFLKTPKNSIKGFSFFTASVEAMVLTKQYRCQE